MKRMVLTFAPLVLFLLFIACALGCENKDASQGVPPPGTEIIEAQPKPGPENVAPVEDDPGLPPPKSTRPSVSLPSAEIEAKVKELALLDPNHEAMVRGSPVMRLHYWDYHRRERIRYEGYPVRGKPSDGLAIWLIEAPYSLSSRNLYCLVRIDNLGKSEVHLTPGMVSRVLLECRPGAPAKEIAETKLPPLQSHKPYHVIPSRGSIRLVVSPLTPAAPPLPFAGDKKLRLQVALRGRRDKQSNPKAWVGEVRSPEFEVVVPPPEDDEDLEHYRQFLRASRERGSFPEVGVISWGASSGWGLWMEGNRITGAGIWLAMPDDLRRLSAEEVRTICDFLLRDDTFAKGIRDIDWAKAKSIPKYQPHEYFSIVTAERWGRWRGNGLKPSLSKEWKTIRDDLLRGRLEEARKRIRRDAQRPAGNRP